MAPVALGGIGFASSRTLLRDIAAPLTIFSFAAFMPFSWLSAAFLVVGQAHFFMAFRAQYRAGKMTLRYWIAATALFALAVVYFAWHGELVPIFLVASFLFAAHFAFDELFLHGDRVTPARLFSVIGFVALFFSFTLASLYPSLALWALTVSVLIVCWALVRTFSSSNRPSHGERYLWLVGLLVVALAYFGPGEPAQLLAAIILVHCFNWYVDFPRRYEGDSKKLRSYWVDVVVILLVSLATYALYSVFSVEFLKYAYEVKYYDAWALAHFALSLRLVLPDGRPWYTA